MEDEVIDNTLDDIGKQLGNLLTLSNNLHDVTETQSSKLKEIENGVDKATNKQDIANKRQKLFMMTHRNRRKQQQKVRNNNTKTN